MKTMTEAPRTEPRCSHRPALKEALQLLVCVASLLLAATVNAAPTLGLNFARDSGGTTTGTADGLATWDNVLDSGGYPGTITLSGSSVWVQYACANSWWAGSGGTSEQRIYACYLDDGDNGTSLVSGDGIGVSVTVSNLSAWVSGEGGVGYKIRCYGSTDTSSGTFRPVHVRSGAPDPANGTNQLTSLPILETVIRPVLGGGNFPPDTSNPTSTPRGYGSTVSLLTNDVITLTVPSRNGTVRGTLAALKFDVIMPVAPTLATDIQPTAPSRYVHENVTFTAAFTGTPPISYQWQHAGTNLPGATGTTLALTDLSVGQAGSYVLYAYNAYGTNNTATATLTVTDVGNPLPVTWDANTGSSGAQDGNGTWDKVNTNWWYPVGAMNLGWTELDSPTFGAGGAGAYTVTLATNVAASVVTFNGSYTITNTAGQTLSLSGAAGITANSNAVITVPLDGTLGMVKSGTGTLTLTAPSTYSGPTTISNGTLQLSDGSLTTSVVTNSGTLAINLSGDQTVAYPIRGTGALVKSGSAGLTLNGGNNYSGGTTINNGILKMGSSTAVGAGPITVQASGTLDLNAKTVGAVTVNGGTIDHTGSGNAIFGDLTLNGGVTLHSTGSWLGMNSATVTGTGNLVLAGSVWQARSGTNATTIDVTGFLIVTNGAEFDPYGKTFFSSNVLGLILQNGVLSSDTASGLPEQTVPSLSGGPTSEIWLNWGPLTVLQMSAGTFAGTISGSKTLTKIGPAALTLSGANTYTGATYVNEGGLLVDGSLDAGSLVTVAAGATLGGSGTVNGSVSVLPDGILAPGDSIGVLTLGGATYLSGITLMEIDRGHSPNSDQLVVSSGGTLSYGGTLTVTNRGGPLQAGDSFALFSAAGASFGDFAVTNLPALGTGLTWQWDAAAGTLAVIGSVATNPTNITYSVSGSALTIAWPSDHTGWTLQAQTNALSVGLSGTWQDVAGSTATNQMTFPIDRTQPTVFYRLKY
jgi:autotransporter-associated beta strand protein